MKRPVYLVSHAVRSMRAREVSMQEILDVIENYQQRWSVSTHDGRPTPDRFIYQGKDLALVVVEKPAELLVLTVLLNQQSQWTDDDARNRHQAAASKAS